MLRTQRCQRNADVPPLWEDDKALTATSCYVLGQGGRRQPVRCTQEFEWVLFGQAWAREGRSPDAGHALHNLLDRVVPRGATLFQRRYTPPVLLATCDGIAPKAFVHAIILLSKWLGEDRFPEGVFAWPPPVPAEVSAG